MVGCVSVEVLFPNSQTVFLIAAFLHCSATASIAFPLASVILFVVFIEMLVLVIPAQAEFFSDGSTNTLH